MSLIERTNVTLPREVVEEVREALAFRPQESETFSYQATGYADGWCEAIREYQKRHRAALAKLKDALDAPNTYGETSDGK